LAESNQASRLLGCRDPPLSWLALACLVCAAGGGDVMVPASKTYHPGQPACIIRIQTATAAGYVHTKKQVKKEGTCKLDSQAFASAVQFFSWYSFVCAPASLPFKGRLSVNPPPTTHRLPAATSRFCCRCHCFPSRLLPPPVAQQTQKIAS